MADVAKEIISIIAEKTGGKIAPPQLSDRLDELGLDSLQVVEMTFLIEEKFNIQIPFNANFDIQANTVGDLVQAVEKLVDARPGVA